MSDTPNPGISCPDCGRVFATFGNVTTIPCTPCAYRRLDAQAAHIVKLETAAIGRNFAKYEQALTLCQAYADRIAQLEAALDEIFVLTSHNPDARVQKANDIIEALSPASGAGKATAWHERNDDACRKDKP